MPSRALPDTPSPRGRMKRILRATGQGLAILALGLALTAVVLEAWARLQPRRFFLEYDPELGFRLDAGAEGEYRGRFLLDPNRHIRTPVSISSLGMRGPERSVEKPPGVRRLVVLGDSFVQAFEVPWEETFYARLERRAEEAGRALQAFPMGVSGYGQAQQLLWFERAGARLEPDVVLLSVFLGNDVTDNSAAFHIGATRPYFALREGELRVVETPDGEARWKYEAAKYLRSFIVYKEIGHRVTALRRLAARLGLVNYAWSGAGPEDGKRLARKRREAYDLTFALLDRIARSVREAGAEPLLMIHGSYPTGRSRSAYALFEEYCRTNGLSCMSLDLEPAEEPALFVPEDEHWSSQGHRRVAERIWSRWREQLLGAPAEAEPARSSRSGAGPTSSDEGSPGRRPGLRDAERSGSPGYSTSCGRPGRLSGSGSGLEPLPPSSS